jgi:hypothetical protein
MKANQQKLSSSKTKLKQKGKSDKTTLKPAVRHRTKKAFKSKLVARRPNPFDAMDQLRDVKKKYLTTPKDTRKPRSQVLTGRHMGPKK